MKRAQINISKISHFMCFLRCFHLDFLVIPVYYTSKKTEYLKSGLMSPTPSPPVDKCVFLFSSSTSILYSFKELWRWVPWDFTDSSLTLTDWKFNPGASLPLGETPESLRLNSGIPRRPCANKSLSCLPSLVLKVVPTLYFFAFLSFSASN